MKKRGQTVVPLAAIVAGGTMSAGLLFGVGRDGGRGPGAARHAARIFAQRPAETERILPAPPPAPEPAQDRMLVVAPPPPARPRPAPGQTPDGVVSMDELRRRPGWEAIIRKIQRRLAGRGPMFSRFESAWVKSGALRARVVYLDTYGSVVVQRKGFFMSSALTPVRWFAEPAGNPEALVGRKAPIYPPGSPFVYEIELELAPGAAPVKDARVFVRQEQVDGERLAGIASHAVSLVPGERASVRGFFTLRTRGDRAVNLERTNVAVLDGEGRVLLHEEHAGLVDPPAARRPFHSVK